MLEMKLRIFEMVQMAFGPKLSKLYDFEFVELAPMKLGILAVLLLGGKLFDDVLEMRILFDLFGKQEAGQVGEVGCKV